MQKNNVYFDIRLKKYKIEDKFAPHFEDNFKLVKNPKRRQSS